MGFDVPTRHTAEALRKTLQQLENDSSVDHEDPAYISLKCALLQRIMGQDVGTTKIRSGIHLVQIFEPRPEEVKDAEATDDSAIA